MLLVFRSVSRYVCGEVRIMAGLEVFRVDLATGDSPGLLAGHMDLPISGTQPGRALLISGWALGRDSRVISIEVWRPGMRLACGVPSLPRRDVIALYPDHPDSAECGFMVA